LAKEKRAGWPLTASDCKSRRPLITDVLIDLSTAAWQGKLTEASSHQPSTGSEQPVKRRMRTSPYRALGIASRHRGHCRLPHQLPLPNSSVMVTKENPDGADRNVSGGMCDFAAFWAKPVGQQPGMWKRVEGWPLQDSSWLACLARSLQRACGPRAPPSLM